MMRLRFHHSAHVLNSFLQLLDYPASWNTQYIQNHCAMLRVEHVDDAGTDSVAGFVWAFWTDDAENPTLDFHVCILPEYRNRWLTPSVWADLHKAAELLGAKRIQTKAIGERPQRLVAEMLVRWLGFQRADDGYVYKDIGDTVGFLIPESRKAGAGAGARRGSPGG